MSKQMSTKFLLYCRPGYESSVAQEFDAQYLKLGGYGYAQFQKHQGYLVYESVSNGGSVPEFDQLIFARQLIHVVSDIALAPNSNRVASIIEEITHHDMRSQVFGDVFVEFPDTEAGKEVAKFCRKFTVPLRNELRRQKRLSPQQNTSLPFLHLFMYANDLETGTKQALIGITFPNQRSSLLNGIKRLKFPVEAPSRSTLKLEEAIQTFIPNDAQQELFVDGMTAVDLGACPGGWTYQLVSRGLRVEAVDNGMIDEALMQSGRVIHSQSDGFTYQPLDGHVDWIVCDMIEKPELVTQLMLGWIKHRKASHAIFNLKLPMKKHYEHVEPLLVSIQRQLRDIGEFFFQAKHLYHNRDEITVILIRNPDIFTPNVGAFMNSLRYS